MNAALVAACRSAACAPPPAGTGGSLPGRGGIGLHPGKAAGVHTGVMHDPKIHKSTYTEGPKGSKYIAVIQPRKNSHVVTYFDKRHKLVSVKDIPKSSKVGMMRQVDDNAPSHLRYHEPRVVKAPKKTVSQKLSDTIAHILGNDPVPTLWVT